MCTRSTTGEHRSVSQHKLLRSRSFASRAHTRSRLRSFRSLSLPVASAPAARTRSTRTQPVPAPVSAPPPRHTLPKFPPIMVEI